MDEPKELKEIRDHLVNEMTKDIEIPAKIIRTGGYWFVQCEHGTIGLGDCEDLELIEFLTQMSENGSKEGSENND